MEEQDIQTPETETPDTGETAEPQTDAAEQTAEETTIESAVEEAGEATEEEPATEQPVEQETPTAEQVESVVEQLGIETEAPKADAEEARLRGLLEAVIYIAEEPMPLAQIAQAIGQPKERVEKILAELMADYEQPTRGLLIREVAGGFKMGTKPEFHEELRTYIKKLKPPLKLSLAALETLAVIAYKQPITAPEIMEIRGVQGGGVLKTLLERKLITAAGRKQVVGRPVLYKTTKDFLVQFGLKDLGELPSLKEFEEWSRLAVGDPEDAEKPVTPAAAEPEDQPELRNEPSPAEPAVEALAPESQNEPNPESAPEPEPEPEPESSAEESTTEPEVQNEPNSETAEESEEEKAAESNG